MEKSRKGSLNEDLSNLIWSIVDKSSTCSKAISDDRHRPFHRQSDPTYGKRVAVEALSLEVNRGVYIRFSGSQRRRKVDDYSHGFGIDRPTSGSAKLLGHDIKTERAKALSRVGAIVEAPAFYDNLSGLQNLKILSSMSGGCSKDRIAEVLDIVGLSGREDESRRCLFARYAATIGHRSGSLAKSGIDHIGRTDRRS